MFLSVVPLERLAAVVMYEQDDLRVDSCNFSETRMHELYETKTAAGKDARGGAELLEFARRAMESSPELADKMEAA